MPLIHPETKGALTIIIKLSDRNIPCTLQDQAAKVEEEWGELVEAYKHFTLAQVLNPDLDHVAEELFDFYEASARWAMRVGIDLKNANQRHLEKMHQREEKEGMSSGRAS